MANFCQEDLKRLVSLHVALYCTWLEHSREFAWCDHCICPVTDHEFRHNIVKVNVDPRGDSRVDRQTTLTMLRRN